MRRISASPGRKTSRSPALGQPPADRGGDLLLQPPGGLAGEEAGLHREGAALAAQHRGAEQGRQALAFERRAHRHQPEVGAQRGARLEAERQAEIALQRALMHLVEDHRRDPGEAGILLQQPGQDALGQHLDAGARADAAVEPDAVADRLAHRLAAQRRHPPGGGARRQPPRLQHQDAPPGDPGLVEQGRRHGGGLAGAGRRLQHQPGPGGEDAPELRQHGFDRQRHAGGLAQLPPAAPPSAAPGRQRAAEAVPLRRLRAWRR
ncbi:MAG: hypothetical protein U1E53_30030 [Dongiaceae bacterium]